MTTRTSIFSTIALLRPRIDGRAGELALVRVLLVGVQHPPILTRRESLLPPPTRDR